MTSRDGFLGPPKTANYRPNVLGRGWGAYPDDRGPLTLWDVERMRRDGQVSFGLRILLAPLSQVTWQVTCDDHEGGEIADVTFRRAWERHLPQLFSMKSYGWMAGEALYREHADGTLAFDRIRDVHPRDATALEAGGRLAGVRVKGCGDLLGPRYVWVANEPEFGGHYGRSCLDVAWGPWAEKSGRHGAREIRRLWYLKNVFRGLLLRHPDGVMQTPEGPKSCMDFAREIVERFEAGGVLTLPNTKLNPEGGGDYEWEVEWPAAHGDVSGLLEYGRELDREILIALGIPPEVVDAADSGSGWSGRSVPFLVYLQGRDADADAIAHALVEQVVRPLVYVNRGKEAAESLELRLDSLVPDGTQEQATQGGGAGAGQGGAMQGGQGADRMSFAERLSHDPWVAYEGSRGGIGWKNSDTGKIVYGQKKPAVRGGAAPRPSATERIRPVEEAKGAADAPPDAPKAVPARAPKATPEEAKQLIAKGLKGEASVAEVSKALMGLTVAQIDGLKKELGLKASGPKAELARKVAERALARARAAPPEKAPAKEKGPEAPPETKAAPSEKHLNAITQAWSDGGGRMHPDRMGYDALKATASELADAYGAPMTGEQFDAALTQLRNEGVKVPAPPGKKAPAPAPAKQAAPAKKAPAARPKATPAPAARKASPKAKGPAPLPRTGLPLIDALPADAGPADRAAAVYESAGLMGLLTYSDHEKGVAVTEDVLRALFAGTTGKDRAEMAAGMGMRGVRPTQATEAALRQRVLARAGMVMRARAGDEVEHLQGQDAARAKAAEELRQKGYDPDAADPSVYHPPEKK